jgi:ADP-heptose:LPS heptosyltransferase
MHRLFLLRAYGDFVILLQALIQSPQKNKYTIIASKHLQPLYEELASVIDLTSIQIQFVNFGITNTQLSLFTNKHLLSLNMLNELKQIKKFIKQNPNTEGQDYVEQTTRIIAINTLTGIEFKAIIQPNAIYSNYNNFFKNTTRKNYQDEEIKNILIIPDARLKKRALKMELIESIKQHYTTKAKKITTARFKNKTNGDDFVYNDFKDLIKYIQEADFIIAADSLPIHLCELFSKPHFMLFPNGHPRNFITPYALDNNSFAEFSNFKLTNLL